MITPHESKTFGVFKGSFAETPAKKIVEAGHSVVWFPEIEVARLDVQPVLDRLNDPELKRGWLVFADPIAVEVFCSGAEAASFELAVLDEIGICALGEAAALGLRKYFVHTDVTANPYPHKDFLREISTFTDRPPPHRALILSEESHDLSSGAEGFAICLSPVYEAKLETVEAARTKALLTGGAVDTLVFSRPEDLITLRVVLRPERVPEALGSIEIYAADGGVYQAAREFGLRPSKIVDVSDLA